MKPQDKRYFIPVLLDDADIPDIRIEDISIKDYHFLRLKDDPEFKNLIQHLAHDQTSLRVKEIDTNEISNSSFQKVKTIAKYLIPVVVIIAFILAIFIYWSTLKTEPPLSVDQPVLGSMVDVRDGNTYKTVLMKDSNIWMGENLRFNVQKGSFAPNLDESVINQYGLLYTINVLDSVCPKGWKLPSDEELRQLFFEYGGYKTLGGASHGHPKKGYSELIYGGESEFDLRLAGFILDTVIVSERSRAVNFNSTGSFWSSTSAPMDQTLIGDTINQNWSFLFSSVDSTILRSHDGQFVANSCRCLKRK